MHPEYRPPPAKYDEAKRKRLPALGLAAFFFLLKELRETFRRINNKEWDELEDPGVLTHFKWEQTWGAERVGDDLPPNFEWGGMRIWWQRGKEIDPTTDVEWDPERWNRWLEEMTTELEALEHRNLKKMMIPG